VRIDDIETKQVNFKENKITLTKNETRFTLRIGKTSTRLESETEHKWLEAIQNFNFKKQ